MYFPHFYNSIFLLLSTVSSVQSPLLLTFAFDNLAKQLRLVVLKIININIRCFKMFVNNDFELFYRFLANVCMCSQAFKKAPDYPKLRFPTVSNYLKQSFNLKANSLS